MKHFTIITGIATLISFVISMKDILPTYSVYVNNVSYILLGLVVGSVISLYEKSEIQIYRFKSTHMFVYVFYIVVAAITLILILTKDGLEMKVLGSIGTFIFLTLFFLKPLLNEGSVTITERITLSDIHAKKGNYSEAIWHLKEVKDILNESDDRIESLESKISELKQKQISNTELLNEI